MKKAIYSISVLCYLVVTCGVVVNFHYCMKKLDAIHFFQTATDICNRCGMETHESNGCCHDEIKVIKLELDQTKAALTVYEIPSLDPIVSVPAAFINAPFADAVPQRHFHNHSPPLLSAQDIYLQNNVFRI